MAEVQNNLWDDMPDDIKNKLMTAARNVAGKSDKLIYDENTNRHVFGIIPSFLHEK